MVNSMGMTVGARVYSYCKVVWITLVMIMVKHNNNNHDHSNNQNNNNNGLYVMADVSITRSGITLECQSSSGALKLYRGDVSASPSSSVWILLDQLEERDIFNHVVSAIPLNS